MKAVKRLSRRKLERLYGGAVHDLSIKAAEVESLTGRVQAADREIERLHEAEAPRQEAARAAAEQLLELLQPAEVEQLAQRARARQLQALGIKDGSGDLGPATQEGIPMGPDYAQPRPLGPNWWAAVSQ